MNRIQDLTGQKFNKLTVIRWVKRDNSRKSFWECVCECGNITVVRIDNLKDGTTKSCGCINRAPNLVGKRFGKLVVVEKLDKNLYGQARYKCRCDCGNFTDVLGNNLQRNAVKSCGCLIAEILFKNRFKDLTGQRFGRLIAIKCTQEKRNENYMWECLCDCGNTCVVKGCHLINSNTRSCGCLAKELKTTHGLSHTKEYANASSRKRRELAHNLDSVWIPEMEMELKNLFTCCVVCGMTNKEHLEKYGTSLEVDHVLPLSKGNGLKPGNAVVLCTRCNSIKYNKNLQSIPKEMSVKIVDAARNFEKYWESRINNI